MGQLESQLNVLDIEKPVCAQQEVPVRNQQLRLRYLLKNVLSFSRQALSWNLEMELKAPIQASNKILLVGSEEADCLWCPIRSVRICEEIRILARDLKGAETMCLRAGALSER